MRLIFLLLFILSIVAIVNANAYSINITGNFNHTWINANGTSDTFNIQGTVTNATVTFTAKGFANFDNANGGYWTKANKFVFTSALSEYANYKVVINGSNWYLYNVTGGLEASLSDTEFWGLVQSDGDDIRVFNQSSQLYFWIEYFNATEQKAIIWVNISQGSSELNIAYGNPSALPSAYSNISKAFLFGDDFNTLDTNKWQILGGDWVVDNGTLVWNGNPNADPDGLIVTKQTFTNNIVIELKGIRVSPGGTVGSTEFDQIVMSCSDINNLVLLRARPDVGEVEIYNKSAGTYTKQVGAAIPTTYNVWRIGKAYYNGSAYIFEYYDLDYTLINKTAWVTVWVRDGYIGIREWQNSEAGDVKYDWIFVAKLADPADVSSTSHYDLYVQNPKLILNGNVVEYAGNLTAGSSVTLNINSTYFVQGVNTISFSSDNLIYTQFDVNIKFNYTYTVLGNVTNTTVSFGTTVDYTPQLIAVVPPANRPVDSVNISVNGNAWTNFDLIGVDIHTPTTVTIKINLPDEKGVNINATVNLDPYALVIHVLDELTKRTIFPANVSVYNSTYVQLNDSVIKQVNNKYAIEYWNISDGKYHVFVDATGYSMRKRFADINTKERLDLYVYLPPSNKSIIVSFYLKDNTGRFPINSTYIIVEKSGIGKIHEEYFNVEGKVDVYLVANDVYYVYVSNGVEIKLLGTYSSSYSTTATLEIGEAVSNIIQRGVSLPMHTVTLYVIKNMKPYANIPIIVKDIYNNTYTVYTDNEGKAVIWVNKTIPYEINVNHSEKVIKAFLPLNEKYIVVVPYNTTYLNQTYKRLVNASNGSIFAIGSNLTKELSPSARGIVTALILWAVMQSAVRVVGNVSVIGLITLIILAIIGLADPISCVFAGLFVVGMYVLKRWL